MNNPLLVFKDYLRYGSVKQYDTNKTVFIQGDIGHGLYYLMEGKVINRFLSECGSERFINYISPGMLFGEEGSNGNSYLSTTTAIAPSKVCYIPKDTLYQICRDHPKASIAFIGLQIENFRKKLQLIRFLDSNIEVQMMFYLAQYDCNTVNIPLNQTIIAKDLNTSRMTVNKVIRKWKNEGKIELSVQMIRILDEAWFYGRHDVISSSNP